MKAMIERVIAANGGTLAPERLVEECLNQMGAISVSDETRSALVEFASKGGDLQVGTTGLDEGARRRIAEMLRVAAATPEFQRA